MVQQLSESIEDTVLDEEHVPAWQPLSCHSKCVSSSSGLLQALSTGRVFLLKGRRLLLRIGSVILQAL